MLQEADMDITSIALNSRRYAGDEFLAVRFLLYPKLNQHKTKDAGRPIYEDVEYIEIMQPGNKDNIYLQPATEMDKSRFAQHYKMWKARTSDNESMTIGTPLSEWAGVTRGQAEELSFFNVKTVEQLANMSDANTGNMMGLGNLKEKAKKYLESSQDNATAQALIELRAENAEMRELLKQVMSDKNAQAAAPGVALTQPHADYGSPKRKRRSKAEMEEATAQENIE